MAGIPELLNPLHNAKFSGAECGVAFWGTMPKICPKSRGVFRGPLERIVRPFFADDENLQSTPALLLQRLELEKDPTEPEGSARNLRKLRKTLPTEAQCLA